MDIFFLSLALNVLSGPAPTPALKLNQQVRISSGLYEGCTGKVANKQGPEYGMYVDCDGEVRYTWIHKRYLEVTRD